MARPRTQVLLAAFLAAALFGAGVRRVHAGPAADPVFVINAPGLGPMLFAGPEPRAAVRRYVDHLVRSGSFSGSGRELRAWQREVERRVGRGPSLAKLHERGDVVGIPLARADELLGPSSRAVRSLMNAVRRGGGTPVLIPPAGRAGQIESYLASIDRLMIPGGADLDPRLYGQENRHAVNTNRKADGYQVQLTRRAIARQLPVEGICRGCQVINVALGGTLIQDLPTERPSDVAHRVRPHVKAFHGVRVAPDSHLFRTVGTTNLRRVVSIHHQAIGTLGRGLRVTGRARDGLPEAIESRDGRIRGYQWHPELSRGVTAPKIFRARTR